MGEHRYKAVMAVLSGGRTVTEVARDWDVSGHAGPPRTSLEVLSSEQSETRPKSPREAERASSLETLYAWAARRKK